MLPEAFTLDEILHPISTDTFVSNYLGKWFLRSQGHPQKFSRLLPWQALNAILEHNRLEFPRLRLVKNGQTIPNRSFTEPSSPTNISRIRPKELSRQCLDGATLIIDSIDDLYDPIKDLAVTLERLLRNRIQVNMYAGWGASKGFNLHWDTHDVFILQVAGSKYWKVYPMTYPHPLKGDSEICKAPTVAPIWDGHLDAGDFLYIPRGWWHEAIALEEPTLHLTVGLHNSNGYDFLKWFAARLRKVEDVRLDLPRFRSLEGRKSYLENLRRAWESEWSSTLLDEYLSETDAFARVRETMGLPWTATEEVIPPAGQDYELKWLPTRAVIENKDVITIACFGKKWTFSTVAGPMLEILQTRRHCSIDDLHQSVSDQVSPAVVRAFVKELVRAGLVTVVNWRG